MKRALLALAFATVSLCGVPTVAQTRRRAPATPNTAVIALGRMGTPARPARPHYQRMMLRRQDFGTHSADYLLMEAQLLIRLLLHIAGPGP